MTPLVCPHGKRLERLGKPTSFIRQSIATFIVLDEPGFPKLSKPSVEQPGVRLTRVQERSKGQWFTPEFPEHSQGRAAPQQVQRDHDGPAGGGPSDWLADARSRHALPYTARGLR